MQFFIHFKYHTSHHSLRLGQHILFFIFFFFNLSECNLSLEIANCQFVGVSSQLACSIDGCDHMPQPVGNMPKSLISCVFFFISVHCLLGFLQWHSLLEHDWSLGYFRTPQVKSSRVWNPSHKFEVVLVKVLVQNRFHTVCSITFNLKHTNNLNVSDVTFPVTTK